MLLLKEKGGIFIQISLSDLKINVGKYVDLAETEEVIITKYGKPAAKLIRCDREPWYTKQIPDIITSVEQLFGTLPSDVDLEDVKIERLLK